MEQLLGNFQRCRKIFERWLEADPPSCSAWTRYATFEKGLGEVTRARALYELAISQPVLDMPEVLWKAYIDMEVAEGNLDRVRDLYERLLGKT